MPPIELELSQMINAESGVSLVVNGMQTAMHIIPMLDGSTVLNGEIVDHSGPYAMAIMAEIKALDLSAGNNGDVLTIAGDDYTLLGIDSDGSGSVVLRLGAVG